MTRYILTVIDSMTEEQKKVLYFLVAQGADKESEEKLMEQLELYKKALEMACYEISASSGDTTESIISFYIQQAREEE